MAIEPRPTLVGPDDPAPVILLNADGGAPFLLTGDHAGRAIPRALGSLGLTEAALDRHIACDIGVAGLGEALTLRLGARFVRQAYSRLVIDCNRDPASDEAIPLLSDGTAIPGNRGLSAADRAMRIDEIHAPYQAAIAGLIAAGEPPILVALHSFTPVMDGVARPWDVGVLHDGANELFARRVLRALRREPGVTVGDNEPYRMDATDHSVPRHAFAAGLAYVELEIRQDLIGDGAGQQHWAEMLATALWAALPG